MIYDCYAVVNHYGTMDFGHYTAFIKHWKKDDKSGKKEWYLYNDTNVNMIKKETVVTSAAYILFYRCRDWHEANIDGCDFEAMK